MRRRGWWMITPGLLMVLAFLLPCVPRCSAAQEAPSANHGSFRASPVMFIENMGQWDANARFQVWGGNSTMWLAENAIWLTVVERTTASAAVLPVDTSERPEHGNLQAGGKGSKADNVKLSFADANLHPRIEPFDRLDTVMSYFSGNEPEKWRRNVPVWGGVRYKDLYPGIDLELSTQHGVMEPLIIVRPGGDLHHVRLQVDGADSIALKDDRLVIATAVGEYELPLLKISGNSEGSLPATTINENLINMPFVIEARAATVSYNIGASDLLFSTFLGGRADDGSGGIAVDSGGNVYVTGTTSSIDFPTIPGGFTAAGTIFVCKLDPTGGSLIYVAFLGGNSTDSPFGIALDAAGNAYVAGTTWGSVPTTPGAFQTAHNGATDIFVAKLDGTGSVLLYSTYLGGSDLEFSGHLAIEANGYAYLSGTTYSSDFPTTSAAFDRTHNSPGKDDAFVAKLNQAATALVYSTFLGGNDWDSAYAIALDELGNAYISGRTHSADFPVSPGAADPSFNGVQDVFVAKLNSAGTGLVYATYLGGSDWEYGGHVAVDSEGNCYITGGTDSIDFPVTEGDYNTSYNGGGDVFLAKINPIGNTFVQVTYLGGSGHDEGYAIAVDSRGDVYLLGITQSNDFPATSWGYDSTHNGGIDLFVSKFEAKGYLTYASYLGGSENDSTDSYSESLAVDFSGQAYIAANTLSPDFPTTPGSIARTLDGASDAVVVKIAPSLPVPQIHTLTPASVMAGGPSFELILDGVNFVGGSLVLWNGANRETAFVSNTRVTATINAADIATSGTVSVTVFNPTPGGGTSNALTFTISPTLGDPYEPDDTCALARFIPADGTVQDHTFHRQADEDWITFNAMASTKYLIEGQVPPASPADLTLTAYNQCGGLPGPGQDYTFSPGVRLEFQAQTTGSVYLKLLNHSPSVYGSQVAYSLSVRAQSVSPDPGALIIVAGRLMEGDALQTRIHTVANAVYGLFAARGYTSDRIYYLATDLTLPGADALASAANLRAAITSWTLDKVGPAQPLTLYLVDHGAYDQLYLDWPRGEAVTPEELDAWLDELETARPGLKVNVIVEACYSGSFIDLPQEVSKPGRVVISSTSADYVAYASLDGAIFSDSFVTGLAQNASLFTGFQSARWAVQAAYPDQVPWLDDNGNGLPNEVGEGQEAQRRGFSYAGTLASDAWPPYIAEAQGPSAIQAGRGVIRARVLDDLKTWIRRVWIVVYPPSYRPPEPGESLVVPNLPGAILQDQGGGWYGVTYTGFDETGVYRVVVYAEDSTGLEAQPLALQVRAGHAVYLPVVIR